MANEKSIAWGVPDWKNKDAYPNDDAMSLNAWRWEFDRHL
jgi:hypothetical protein